MFDYPPFTFDIKPDGRSCCFIDFGIGITYIHKNAYWKLYMELLMEWT